MERYLFVPTSHRNEGKTIIKEKYATNRDSPRRKPNIRLPDKTAFADGVSLGFSTTAIMTSPEIGFQTYDDLGANQKWLSLSAVKV